MNGLSGTAFANTTSFADPIADRSAVRLAVVLTTSPMRRTASMLIPADVVAMFTDAHTRRVDESASGRAAVPGQTGTRDSSSW